MDITKRFNRILNLFFLLQSRSFVTLEELKKRFGISERTIYRDLKSLEAAGIPVLNEAGTGYSLMEGFRLQPAKFSEEEVLSLMVAEKMMQQHETQFIQQHFDAALIKIKSSFRFQQKTDLLQLEDKVLINKSLKQQEYLPNVLDVLLNSILKKKTAVIHYIKREEDQTTARQVEPIGVFYEANNWYVMAYCHLRREYRSFRLDRIKKISLSDRAFSNEHVTLDELRNRKKDATPVTSITIRIDKTQAHSLAWDRDMFGFSHEEAAGDDVLMHFACPHDPCYFVRWFMMFADMGEIVSPAYLQHELADIITIAMQKIKSSALVSAASLV